MANLWLISHAKLVSEPDETIVNLILSPVRKISYAPTEDSFFEEFLSYARFGGPREAAFHAIVRKNFGCTHFIVGRDHAGIKNYYSKYASQNFCKKYKTKIGLKILSFKEPYYCKKCRIMRGAFEKCSHKKIYKKFLSGTVIRRNILKNKKLPNYYLRKEILNKLSKKSIR